MQIKETREGGIEDENFSLANFDKTDKRQHFYNEQNTLMFPNCRVCDGPNESTSNNLGEFIPIKIKNEVK